LWYNLYRTAATLSVLKEDRVTYTEHALLVTTVGADRTIILPDSVPGGATIGIVVLSNAPKRKQSRKERFKAALTEIETAIGRSHHTPTVAPTDAELSALVERARKEPPSA
jgi:hypothetical protein